MATNFIQILPSVACLFVGDYAAQMVHDTSFTRPPGGNFFNATNSGYPKIAEKYRLTDVEM
jgi:hypothetical protein